MIDYDREAAFYDDTRGGPERAAAVASAVAPLIRGPVLDVACGTGIVTALLADGPAFGVDRSPGMLSVAARRLAGRVLLGDATALPVAARSAGTVLMIWLLHLLPAAEPALAEAVRVLRPGGRLITTVDKGAAYFVPPSDVADVTAPWRAGHTATDGFDRVAAFLARRGLRPAGEATFPGLGQARSPRQWREVVRAGRAPWAGDGVDRALAGLPDQDRARPEPVYRLVAFS